MAEVQVTVTLLVMVVLPLMLLEALAAMAVTMVLSEGIMSICGAAMAVVAAMVVPMAKVAVAEREGVVELAVPVGLVSRLLQPSLQVVREPSAFQVLQVLLARQAPVQPVDQAAGSIPNTRLDRVPENMGTLREEGLMV